MRFTWMTTADHSNKREARPCLNRSLISYAANIEQHAGPLKRFELLSLYTHVENAGRLGGLRNALSQGLLYIWLV